MTLAEITTNGIVGDRIVHVRGPEGVRTSRRHHNLIGVHATLGPDGEPLADGLPWALPEVLERVRAAAGPDAMLARYDGPSVSTSSPCWSPPTVLLPHSAATSAACGRTSSSTASTASTSSVGLERSSTSATSSSHSILVAAAAR